MTNLLITHAERFRRIIVSEAFALPIQFETVFVDSLERRNLLDYPFKFCRFVPDIKYSVSATKPRIQKQDEMVGNAHRHLDGIHSCSCRDELANALPAALKSRCLLLSCSLTVRDTLRVSCLTLHLV